MTTQRGRNLDCDCQIEISSGGQKSTFLLLDSCSTTQSRTLSKTNTLRSHRGSRFGSHLDRVERAVQIFFEFRQLWSDWLLELVNACQYIGGLQAVSGDAQYGSFLR